MRRTSRADAESCYEVGGRKRKKIVRHGLFQTLSILTTTGYASVDFELWSEQAKLILLVLMFV